jgi:hypothetical protein
LTQTAIGNPCLSSQGGSLFVPLGESVSASPSIQASRLFISLSCHLAAVHQAPAGSQHPSLLPSLSEPHDWLPSDEILSLLTG